MGLVDSAKQWLWQVAFKKLVVRGVTLFVAWVGGIGLTKYGIDVNAEALTAAIYLGLETLRNWTKVKFPKIGGYL